MKTKLRILIISLFFAGLLFLGSGCDNTSVGVGFSGYDSSSGMSYGYGVSSGPYGTRSSTYMGYSSGGYYGRPHYPYSRW